MDEQKCAIWMIGVRPEGLTKNLCMICSFLISLCNRTTGEVFSCDSTRKWRKTSGFGLWNPRNPTILKAQPKTRTHSHRERRNTKWRRTKAISSSIRSHCWTKWLQTPITSSTSSLSSLTSPFAAPPPMSSRLPSPPIFFTEYSIPLSINLYHFPIFFIVDLVYLRECHILMFQSHTITLPLVWQFWRISMSWCFFSGNSSSYCILSADCHQGMFITLPVYLSCESYGWLTIRTVYCSAWFIWISCGCT